MFALTSFALSLAPLAATVDQWIAVVNNAAGDFHAQRVADALQERLGELLTVYRTHEDPAQRVADLAELIQAHRPSETRPLGVIALGGDGTTVDALKGILRSLAVETPTLAHRTASSLTDQLLSSGIRLGLAGLGGANDLASLAGAPGSKVDEIVDYMTTSRLFALNMGLATLDDEQTDLFAHTLSAGTTIAAVFEKTSDLRGMAKKRRQKVLGALHILYTHPFHMKWQRGGDAIHKSDALELIAHAVPRAAEDMGFPGTPQHGVGIKIFPRMNLWQRMRLLHQTYLCGRACNKANPDRVLPTEQLRGLPTAMQQALEPGETMTASFHELGSSTTLPIPVQANGEAIGRSKSLRIQALIPFPAFMIQEGSLFDRLGQRLLPPPANHG